jgi:Tfp pilus assembly protein FimV
MTVYLVAALAFIGLLAGGFFEGYSHGESHIQAAWDADKAAQGKALADAEAKLIEAQKTQDTLQTVVEKDHEDLAAKDAQFIAGDTQRVRDIAAALRASALSGPVGHPTQPVGTPAVPSSDGKATGGLDEIAADIAAIETAGYHDSSELTGIYALAPK